MVLEKKSLAHIAKSVGCNPKTVSGFLQRKGWSEEWKKRSRCELNRELVLKMATDGCSLHEIGRAVGTNDRRVRQFLDKEGVVRKYPKAYAGARNPSWKGGRKMDGGYVCILSPDHPNRSASGYVREHRLVMEKMIGRLLLPNEVVHHRDGNPGNNQPDNLMLFSENREHLAYDLKGKCPKWTPQGLERMQKAAVRGREILRNKTLEASKLGVRLSHKKRNHPQGVPQIIPQIPLQTEPKLGAAHPMS